MPDENNVSRETDETEDQQPTDQDTPDRETEEPAEDDVSRETSEAEEPAERSEVGQLRRESANYRTRLRESEQRADELARELVAARIRVSGRLADATDLDPDPALLEEVALDAAIDYLLERKPQLKDGSVGVVRQHEGASS